MLCASFQMDLKTGEWIDTKTAAHNVHPPKWTSSKGDRDHLLGQMECQKMRDEAGQVNYWILIDGEPAADGYSAWRDRRGAFRNETDVSGYFILQRLLVNSQRRPYDVLLGIEWGQIIVCV